MLSLIPDDTELLGVKRSLGVTIYLTLGGKLRVIEVVEAGGALWQRRWRR